MESIKNSIHNLYTGTEDFSAEKHQSLFEEFINLLNRGDVRAAEPDGDGGWKVNLWVKEGILTLFKYSNLEDMSIGNGFNFFDKNTLPLRPAELNDGIRIVPGGSSIRTGSFVAKGVICMPPMYINIGAYVDEGTMIDSHALVGTCGQIGKGVHLSAASQIGGVLEPPGAKPVIIEDNVMIGGNCGIYEGVRVRKRAVLGSGVILNSSTKVYDLVNENILSATADNPLEIPEAAVVVPGSRKMRGDFAGQHGLSIATPMIIKYRDDRTDAKTALEEALR